MRGIVGRMNSTTLEPSTATKPAHTLKKRIEWAYPSSDSAAKFGFPRTGCWVIYVGNKRLAGYSSAVSAVVYARSLPEFWDELFLLYTPPALVRHLPEINAKSQS